MQRFQAQILLSHRRSILNPEAAATLDALKGLGFGCIESLTMGKIISFTLEAPDAVAAQDLVTEMVTKSHVYNPTMQDLQVSVEAIP